jgi:hypothetical protein
MKKLALALTVALGLNAPLAIAMQEPTSPDEAKINQRIEELTKSLGTEKSECSKSWIAEHPKLTIAIISAILLVGVDVVLYNWVLKPHDVKVQAKDKDGKPLTQKVTRDGKEVEEPVYEFAQAVDKDGNPVVDESGNPVYQTDKDGNPEVKTVKEDNWFVAIQKDWLVNPVKKAGKAVYHYTGTEWLVEKNKEHYILVPATEILVILAALSAYDYLGRAEDKSLIKKLIKKFSAKTEVAA